MPSHVSKVGTEKDLARAVEELTRELSDAHRREAASADILKVISRSTFSLQEVLDGLIESAVRLTGAEMGLIYKQDGDFYRAAAIYGASPESIEVTKQNPILPGRQSATGRAVLERRVIHIEDVVEDPEYTWAGQQGAQVRTILAVPMLRENAVVGVIVARRTRVQPFTDKQIELLETFADQAVIAIENTRLFEVVQARTKELTETLEYQTATSDVLSVISRSKFDLQPVLQSVVETAARLCRADNAIIYRLEDGACHLAASHGHDQEAMEAVRARPHPIDSGTVVGRAITARATVQIEDVQADPLYQVKDLARRGNVRSVIGVPLMRAGEPIGAIALGRSRVEPFNDRQIELVTTFADQAVIAIENTRLFEEVQARTRDATEALEYQTATSEVLNVISRSPSRLQPVLDAIVETAAQLCHADNAHVFRPKDGNYQLVAYNRSNTDFTNYLLENPIEPGKAGSATGRAIAQRRTVHIPDNFADPEQGIGVFAVSENRSVLSVPLLRNDEPVGAITVGRRQVAPFSNKEIELITTFADQAVIAIENTRLFEEVQARNRELRVTLEQQTATSELLKVIGRSTFDLEPVFKTLAESAVRLCSAVQAAIFRFDGQFLRLAIGHNFTSQEMEMITQNPIALGRGSAAARAALERRTIHIHDVLSDPEFTYLVGRFPFRTLLAVPMLRADELLGVIVIRRDEVLPFTDNQITLMETFAGQAVIAIENARLVDELQARNRDLTALGEVGRAVSSTLDLKVVLKTIVDRAVELSGTDAGSIFYFREDVGRFELGETTGLDEEMVAKFRRLDIAAGQTGLGEAIGSGKPLQVADITKRASNALRDAAIEAGLRAGLIVPLLGGEHPLGALVLQRRQPGEFPAAVVTLMQAFADQSAIALENARLFGEIAQKSRELEIASQHKSQFVANMSHELRTPLAAVLGYAELMQEGFYEPQGPKSLDALTRIRSNGKHLLGLINAVLDIAKIESGQFTLNMVEYAIESVVETVRSATESLAQNKKLALKTEVAKSLPIGIGDEQRLTQVLLNLVGNAIKFTDKGEVRVAAKTVNGHFAVSVTDTGPGIPQEHQERIFEHFHQVDSSLTKAKGGTGLGLAIAKQIVEMHGGRIWVESTVGKGSTFQMEIPTRAAFRPMS
jgi:GAF domain-containing protein/anti-sigma regulatory factor (Ser/Thr protein kinase)